LIDSTMVVIIAMLLLGAYVAFIDFSMVKFMEFLTTFSF
jgi:preprotein translocase subunit SecE